MAAQPASDVNGSQSAAVNHPKHYNSHPSGVECVEFAELLPGNLSHACVYVWRHADKGTPEEDLEKALWFLNRESERHPDEQDESRAVLGIVPAPSTGARAAALIRIRDRARPLKPFVEKKDFVATVVALLLAYELAKARELVTDHLKLLRSKGLTNA
ncbi:MAG TPA: DUF3310 domain-containing protein [Candidatus Krumholzibacteria bacterium]